MPDALFVSNDARKAGRVKEIGDPPQDCVELEGPPDMVLEVVSNSSATKDLVDLPQLYWEAGVLEYWLIDARTKKTRFEIRRQGRTKYRLTRSSGGWQRSDVFGMSFRLTRKSDRLRWPLYTLEVK
jgi:Uma2 family endonuclease